MGPPLPVLAAGTVRQATLRCLLSLRRADPDLCLALHLDGAVYESNRAEGDFAAALATVQRVLPPDIHLQTCIACAFSDYFPAPVRGLSGGLACFRGAKDAYRDVAGGDDVADLWDRRTGFVQEIWSCREFEPRPAHGAARGTGEPSPRTGLSPAPPFRQRRGAVPPGRNGPCAGWCGSRRESRQEVARASAAAKPFCQRLFTRERSVAFG